jgi:hypothetical protein
MKIKRSLCLAIFTFTVHICTCLADDIVLIEDFEFVSYEKWIVEGDAFGKGPIEEDMVGVLGSKVAASTDRGVLRQAQIEEWGLSLRQLSL